MPTINILTLDNGGFSIQRDSEPEYTILTLSKWWQVPATGNIHIREYFVIGGATSSSFTFNSSDTIVVDGSEVTGSYSEKIDYLAENVFDRTILANAGNGGSSGAGTSGYSGRSGYSGYSGITGTGTSGFSGRSGFSGYSGATGTGTSGFSGYSGAQGAAGSGAGTSGFSGYSGRSGYSGFSGGGSSGLSGYSGFSGKSGYSGISGFSGAIPTPNTVSFQGSDFVNAGTEEEPIIQINTARINTLIAAYLSDHGIGEPLPQADAPTSLIIDDDEDTASWTLVGFDAEYSTNYTDETPIWTDAVGTSCNVGDVAIAIGDFAVRAKADETHSASDAITNETAFTAAAVAENILPSSWNFGTYPPFFGVNVANIESTYPDPVGGNKATRYTTNNATGAEFYADAYPTTNGVTQTLSIYAKAGTLDDFYLWLSDNSYSNYAEGIFNLTAGTVTSVTGTGVTADIEAVVGYAGWHRLSITYTPTFTASNGWCYFGAYTTTAGNVDNVYMFGMQLNGGSAPGTYVEKP